jgi:hypothetical protein
MKRGNAMSDKEILETEAMLEDADEEETEVSQAVAEFRNHIANRFLRVI